MLMQRLTLNQASSLADLFASLPAPTAASETKEDIKQLSLLRRMSEGGVHPSDARHGG